MAYLAVRDLLHFHFDVGYPMIKIYHLLSATRSLDSNRDQNKTVVDHIQLNKPYLVSIVLRRKKCQNVGRNPSPSLAQVRPVMCLVVLYPV